MRRQPRSAPKALLRPEIAPAHLKGPERTAPEQGGPEGQESPKGRALQRAPRAFPAGEAGLRQTNRKPGAAGWRLAAGGCRLGSAAASPGLRGGEGPGGLRRRSQPRARGVLTGRDPRPGPLGTARADGAQPGAQVRAGRGRAAGTARLRGLSRPGPAPKPSEPGMCRPLPSSADLGANRKRERTLLQWSGSGVPSAGPQAAQRLTLQLSLPPPHSLI